MNDWEYSDCFPLQIDPARAVENTDCICEERVRPSPPNECPEYDIKPSDGEAPEMEPWGMWSTPSLPLLLDPLWPGVVASDRVLSMGQNEHFDIWTACKRMTC